MRKITKSGMDFSVGMNNGKKNLFAYKKFGLL